MRSKLKATNSVEDEKVQYLLNAVLNTIKYNDEGSVGELIQTLRQGSSPGEVALHLRQNLTLLQERGAIAKMEVDDSDLFSLASRINTQDELQYLTSEQYINTQDYTVDAFFPTSDDSSGLIGTNRSIQNSVHTNPLQSIPHVWTDGDISLPIEIQNTHPLHWSPLISEPTSTLATGVTLGRQNLPKISVNTMLSYAIPSQVCVEATADQTHSIGISSPFTSPLHTVAPWQAQVDAMQEFGDCFDSASTSAQFATVQPQGPVFNQHPLQMHFRNSTDISHSGSAINPTSSLVNTEAGQERRSSEIDICVAQ